MIYLLTKHADVAEIDIITRFLTTLVLIKENPFLIYKIPGNFTPEMRYCVTCYFFWVNIVFVNHSNISTLLPHYIFIYIIYLVVNLW